jgi:PhnB protein
MEEAHMPQTTTHIRHGGGSVRVYLYGPVDLPEFVCKTFDATEIERFEFGSRSFHVEMRIGDSSLVIEAGELPVNVKPWTCSAYVYVEDVDAVFQRAIQLGAKQIAPVEDKPYQERQGGFVDSAGNTWWVATTSRSTRVPGDADLPSSESVRGCTTRTSGHGEPGRELA